jgi:hypothetical protein
MFSYILLAAIIVILLWFILRRVKAHYQRKNLNKVLSMIPEKVLLEMLEKGFKLPAEKK